MASSKIQRRQMCDQHTTKLNISSRRSFMQLGAFSALALTSQIIPGLAKAAQPDAPLAKPQNLKSPDEALATLMAGNQRYVDGVARRHDFLHEREALSASQNPFAAMLSCADSRIAPEYAFDSGRGDIFAVRVAGNFVNDDGLGSLEYAATVLNTPLIMVMGHDKCGAFSAAIMAKKEDAAFPGHIQKLADRLKGAVEKVEDMPGDMLANAIKQNVLDAVAELSSRSSLLAERVKDGKLKIVGGVYRLATGRVDMVS